MSGAATAWRGTLVDFVDDPCVAGAAALRHFEDGLLAWRTAQARSLEEKLFMLMILDDDRAVETTCILGRPWGNTEPVRT